MALSYRTAFFGPLLFVLIPASVSLSSCGGDVFEEPPGGRSGGSGSGGASNTGGSFSGSGGAQGGSGGTAATGGMASTGGAPSGDYTSCTHNGQCTLMANSCCGTCGAPTTNDMVGVRVDSAQDYFEEICPIIPPCPACAAMQEPNLFAYCEMGATGNGTCTAADMRTHDYSACTQDDDCAVMPTACCECNAGNQPWEIVAINQSHMSDFTDSLCATVTTPICGDCLWSAPAEVTVSCVQGHCALSDPRALP